MINEKFGKNEITLKEYKLATFGDRFLGVLIDIFLIGIPIGIVYFLTLVSGYNFKIFFEWILPSVIVIGFWIIYAGTPGKLILNMYIVDKDTKEKINATQAIIRNLVSIVSMLVIGIGYIWVIFDKKNQAWHDKLANTIVVKKKKNQEETAEF